MGDRRRGTAWERLVHEAGRAGLRTCLYIVPETDLKSGRHSKLSGVALVDRGGQLVAQVSLLHDDRLDEAAKDLLHELAAKRGSA